MSRSYSSLVPRPSSPARRMTPAPARPPASRRTTRSGARCRGAVPRPRPDPRADCPAARCRSSAGEARVAAPIVEQGPAVGNAATRDDAEEHRVIPAWDLGLFFALDAGEHAVEHRYAVLALLVADAIEPIGMLFGEPSRQRFLIGREHVQHEALGRLA